jgi:D-alanyl-D-alanine endopeptidase (penicillin-binding protein 7)
MKKLFFILTISFLIPSIASAQSVDLAQLTAQGVAIYGWKNGTATVLYSQKQNYLFPVASITKLVTAKAVEMLYPETSTFTITQDAMTDTGDTDDKIVAPGMVFSRDDLLRALLISSNNGVAKEFAAAAAPNAFINAMNAFLHTNAYTTTSFTNPTGLDPVSKSTAPNRLTPQSVSYLISDIFTKDPLLTSILETKAVAITDKVSGTAVQLTSTNELNADPLYNYYVILSKTGTTDLAGQDLAFVTSGEGKFDYVTVVFMHSKDRYADGKVILDWLQRVLAPTT